MNKLQSDLFEIFNKLNDYFFQSKLSVPIISLVIMESKDATGSLLPFLFADKKEKDVHLLKMNIMYFNRSSKYIILTLLHEMTHIWQLEYGTISSKFSYHNKEFSEKMESFGIEIKNIINIKSCVGYRVSSIVIKGGSYDKFFNEHLSEYDISILNEVKNESSKVYKKNKSLYVCDICNARVWGKPGLLINCPECNIQFKEAKECQRK